MAKALGKTEEANQSEPLSKNECVCIHHCGLETQEYKEDTTLPELQSAYDRECIVMNAILHLQHIDLNFMFLLAIKLFATLANSAHACLLISNSHCVE